MNYFKGISNSKDLRKKYIELSVLYHPDRYAGTDELYIEIKKQYEKLLETQCKEEHKEPEREDFTTSEMMDILRELWKLEGISIEVCGIFIWVSGDTKKSKDKLKEIGLRYASKKIMWYWKPLWYRKKNRSEWDIKDIRHSYGSVDKSKQILKIGV